MQETIWSFLEKHDRPLNKELQKMALVFMHPLRNKISIHNMECINGKFKITTLSETIIPDYQRLFVTAIGNSNASIDQLSPAVADLESNKLIRSIAAKHPDKLLAELLPKDVNIKSLIAFSGYQWLKKAHPTFLTDEYKQLAKKFRARQLDRKYHRITSTEKSILLHVQDTRAQLLQFASQLRANDKNPAPQFALDFLDDAIEEKREQEKQAQQTNHLLCFINLIPS